MNFTRAYTAIPATSGFMKSTGAGSLDLTQNTRLADTLKGMGVPIHVLSSHDNIGKNWGEYPNKIAVPLENYDHRFDLASEQISTKAVETLSTLKSPFLLILHYLDAHDYYVPTPLFDYGSSNYERYLAEVSFVDHHLGSVIENLPETTALIVVSDHGEEFRDHGYFKHGNRVYDESSRILLMIHHPSLDQGVNQVPVSNMDLGPTISALLGSDQFQTLDFESSNRCVPLKGANRLAKVQSNTKFIYNSASRTAEKYDLRMDPYESNNLWN